MTRSPHEHLAYRVGQLGRGGVLDQEGVRARFHRRTEIAGAAEGREDDDLHRGELRVEFARRLDARPARHLDVEQRNVHLVGAHRRQHLVTACHLGDHLEVRVQAEQCRKGLADHRLVFGQEESDHEADPRGTRTVSVKPP